MSYNILKCIGCDKEHLIQKCLPWEKNKKPIKYPLLASEKIDGVFCLAAVTADEVTIYSRTGEEYLSMNHLKPELLELAIEAKVDIIIFEAYIKDTEQSIISGYARDKSKQHPQLRGYVHDGLILSDFEGYSKTYMYHQRIAMVGLVFLAETFKNLDYAVQVLVSNEEQIRILAERVWAMGGEGLVVRDPNSYYERGKRNASMLKVKQGVSYDLKVLCVEEGKGKNVGKVGKLICQWKDGKTIAVGSGLSDKERERWFSPFLYDEIVGKIVQIDAMCESSKGLLREPRFKGIRYDKTKGDY